METNTATNEAQSHDELAIDTQLLKKAALILRAINHKLRQDILKLIDKHGTITVTDLYVGLSLDQSVASQHLAILRKAGIVQTKRDGKYIFYSVNHERIASLEIHAKDLLLDAA